MDDNPYFIAFPGGKWARFCNVFSNDHPEIFTHKHLDWQLVDTGKSLRLVLSLTPPFSPFKLKVSKQNDVKAAFCCVRIITTLHDEGIDRPRGRFPLLQDEGGKWFISFEKPPNIYL